MRTTTSMTALDIIPDALRAFAARRGAELAGLVIVAATIAIVIALLSWSVEDPSFNHATPGPVRNLLGSTGAVTADLLMQMLGLGVIAVLVPPGFWGCRLLTARRLERIPARVMLWIAGAALAAGFASLLPIAARWPLPTGLGGVVGDAILLLPKKLAAGFAPGLILVGVALAAGSILALSASVGLRDRFDELDEEEHDAPVRRRGGGADDDAGGPGFALIALGAVIHAFLSLKSAAQRQLARRRAARAPSPRPAPWQTAPQFSPRDFDPPLGSFEFASGDNEPFEPAPDADWLEKGIPEPGFDATAYAPPATRAAARQKSRTVQKTASADAMAEPDSRRIVAPPPPPVRPGQRAQKEAHPSLRERLGRQDYVFPPLNMLAEAKHLVSSQSEEALSQNARLLEGVLDDFGVKGEIINVRPGPVVTLYELEPAPGIKSSRVIGLADDIARSMSAISARVAVVQGRNAIGIELPNQRRETVFLRELLGSDDFEKSKHRLAIALGKNIGGEPIIVDLARMPHLLVAGTTGSGKSVAINTMILSLLYRLRPEECRLIMVDPKMLELSVYDGIPHLLTPVVTDPKKAVVALKWAVREMEDRYKKMSKLGVRNIDGFNARVVEATAKGETLMRTVQTGFDRETGEAIYEHEPMDLSPLPFIVVIVDEMADLMMVAGKDIEGAIQRLAQMARAAGIHLIMATQRPSVDVITGTIKANFPTRISFQVTSKIDSRTILGEQGAEQLLGQGDMLYMAGGGRISRVHGPFVADGEVEKVVAHLKSQGQPEYLESITSEDDSSDEEGEAVSPGSMDAEESGDLYDRAVAIVLRDRKCSTSYIQRRLSVGYNKAASLVERMEQEGVVGAPNHSGKRAILVGGGVDRGAFDLAGEA
ncbi:cell divisionFtsK/SpoIIIE [Methylocella silvestris BL2]|uniref:DNA translocase FtsK n=1 Tax=Methylocella silvestris (strain DSM 15510 / CIP 108128 / LMG 27833 / NCIMB 13906 / BL2) TaxID=395965 RepID=B8EQN5_METSB|nr:DNA translocase FtsK [Methylocella silvestris]ACK49306.1 cell divisionFtsK/SpoIIIE [Methylocella silvestris BL2]